MTTINDVAKKAEVSVSTVSKVLKNYPNISQKTRDKVMKVVDELGYVPNAVASALSSKNFQRVALWINVNDSKHQIDEVNMRYITGAFEEADNKDISIIPIFSMMYKDKSADELLRILKSQGVTGLVVFGITKNSKAIIEIIERQAFHCVVVDAPNVNEKTSSITVDHYSAQYEVGKKMLVDHLCRKMLYIAGGKDGYVTDMRLAGIKRLQKEYGFELEIQYADFKEKNAYELTHQYGMQVDCIACASDLMAIGALNALREMDIYCPVCGYDGIALMSYVKGGMYTVKQDFYAISQTALYEVQRLLQGGTGKNILLDYEIIRPSYHDILK